MGFAVQVRYYDLSEVASETRDALIYLAEKGGGGEVATMGERLYFFTSTFTDGRTTFLGTLRASVPPPPTEERIQRFIEMAKENWGYDDDEARAEAMIVDTSVEDEKKRLREIYGEDVYARCEVAAKLLDALKPTGSLYF
jgi:hypothetical protein